MVAQRDWMLYMKFVGSMEFFYLTNVYKKSLKIIQDTNKFLRQQINTKYQLDKFLVWVFPRQINTPALCDLVPL